jgi:hypothetical protein
VSRWREAFADCGTLLIPKVQALTARIWPNTSNYRTSVWAKKKKRNTKGSVR